MNIRAKKPGVQMEKMTLIKVVDLETSFLPLFANSRPEQGPRWRACVTVIVCFREENERDAVHKKIAIKSNPLQYIPTDTTQICTMFSDLATYYTWPINY